MRLKVAIDWIINKKQAIHCLVINGLPIYRAIKDFIQNYIRHMEDLTEITEKCMNDLSKNGI